MDIYAVLMHKLACHSLLSSCHVQLMAPGPVQMPLIAGGAICNVALCFTHSSMRSR